ncbi:hypothetical protein B0I35DRAFT_443570 [Stachybotrys elegans]|uniref:AttH domain-containing protein n=1 Tax=Stachybotrys elegans TaxID=80388 RepID=A0A8K0SFA7_9HYPO|nr:hypothetical protein B0I35DRAFT_443570 [Stachybotrys elegans]
MLSLQLIALGLLPTALAETVIYPNVIVEGPVDVEYTFQEGSNIDSPKLLPNANETTYDWWYFDAKSASTNQSINVVFFNGGPGAFINSWNNGPQSVDINGVFADGSLIEETAASADPNANGVITFDETSISLEWEGSGCSFTGTDVNTPNAKYVVSIDSPATGVFGTITFDSLGPPTLLFDDGVGYHDKNWGDRRFVEVVQWWYWGHGRAGPYSAVWFDAFDREGNEHVSGYVLKDGEVVFSSCDAGSVVVRPWGANSLFPPQPTFDVMEGIAAVFDLGDKELVFNVTTDQTQINGAAYLRLDGPLKVTEQGPGSSDEVFHGISLYENFRLP